MSDNAAKIFIWKSMVEAGDHLPDAQPAVATGDFAYPFFETLDGCRVDADAGVSVECLFKIPDLGLKMSFSFTTREN
jgi:hypothetical protein